MIETHYIYKLLAGCISKSGPSWQINPFQRRWCSNYCSFHKKRTSFVLQPFDFFQLNILWPTCQVLIDFLSTILLGLVSLVSGRTVGLVVRTHGWESGNRFYSQFCQRLPAWLWKNLPLCTSIASWGEQQLEFTCFHTHRGVVRIN